MFVCLPVDAGQTPDFLNMAGSNGSVLMDSLVPRWVERFSAGGILYCAVHRSFHDASSFSGGAHGQRKRIMRYCIPC